MFDKFINPLPVFYTIFVVMFNVITGVRENVYYILVPVFGWVVLTRFFRLIPHLFIKPSHLPYVPYMVAFQFFFPFLKIYALFTLGVTDWGSRSEDESSHDFPESDWANTNKILASDEPDTDLDAASSREKVLHAYSQSNWSEQKARRRKTSLCFGWLGVLLTIACLGCVGFFITDTLVKRWRITAIATNRATSSVDRSTGIGLFDSVSQKTFITYAGEHLDPMVMEYDHANNRFSNGPKAVGRAVPDFHNCKLHASTSRCFSSNLLDPKMVMADDGHLVVTWTDSPVALFAAKSPFPHSIAGQWETKKINDERPTYQCIVKSSNGDLYIFYRRSYSVGKSLLLIQVCLSEHTFL